MKPIELPAAADRSYIEGPGGVSFGLNVDEATVPCYVTRAALETYFGADPDAAPDDAGASLRAFDAHAGLIRRLAGLQWRRRRRPAVPAVVLTVDAVFRALARR